MSDSTVLIVLPTLGERLEFLEQSLLTCQDVALHVPATIALIAPAGATGARNLAKKYGAKVVDDPGSGMASAINAGIAIRTTERYYVWVGDDDELVAEGVDILVKSLDNDDAAVVAHGHCDYIDDGGRILGTNSSGKLAQVLMSWGPNLIPHPGTVIRLDALSAIGNFDPALRYALDLDVFLRLRKVGTIISRRVLASRFRWHSGSATVADRSASNREAIAVKNRNLSRWVRPVSWLWNYPVALASQMAADMVSRRVASNRLGLR